MKKCPKCNAKLPKDRRRCPECGEFVAKKRKGQLKTATFVLGGIGVLFVVLAIVVISTFANAGKKSTLYVKGSEMAYVKAGSDKEVKLTEELVYEKSMDQFDLEYMSNHYYSKLIKESKSGDRIYYPTNIIRLSNYTLTYKDMDEKDGEIVKVAQGVSDYKISEDGKVVVYMSEGTLYRYDGEEAKVLDNGVSNFEISKDGKKIVYLNRERNICLFQSDKTKKLVKEVSALDFVSEDCSSIYYTKDSNLYKKDSGKDAKKITSKITSVVKIYETGEIYYLKENAQKILASDYVENDVKEEKDDIQKELKSHEIETHTYELCYYNGKTSKVVAEHVQQENIKIAAERPVLVYTACDFTDIEKVKLSEISSVWEVEESVLNYINGVSQYYVATENKTKAIKETDVQNIVIAKDGETIYYVADIPEEQEGVYDATGKLYKMTVSGNSIQAENKYDKDVFAKSLKIVGKDGILYYKNVNEVTYTMQGDLYINKKLADNNVKLDSAVCYDEVDDKAVYYFTDWKYQESMGTLKKVKGNKVTELRKAAHSFYSMKKGQVLFIGDYSVDTYAGNLYLHTRGKAHKIDKDVVAIMQNRE